MKNLRQVRESRNLTQEQLAGRLPEKAIVKQVISAFERGAAEPSSDVLMSIFEVLATSPAELGYEDRAARLEKRLRQTQEELEQMAGVAGEWRNRAEYLEAEASRLRVQSKNNCCLFCRIKRRLGKREDRRTIK